MNKTDNTIFLRDLSITLTPDKGISLYEYRINNTIYSDTKETLDSITIIGKISRLRKKSNKMCFILLRDGINSIQIIFTENEHVSRDYIKNMVAKNTPESIVKITGNIVHSPFPVDSATLKHWEMNATKIETVVESQIIPIQIYKPDAGLDVRLNNRCLDLRAIRNQLIFRIQHQFVSNIQNYLNDHKFTQIFTPKIMEGVAESGSEVFKLDYFGKQASLAQSPQLFKQMAINSGMGQIYEIGPVFRAENSNGNRHLTQYTSIDIEMEFIENYHQVINTLYEIIQYSITLLHNSPLLIMWKDANPDYQPLEISEKPIIITYKDAVTMLTESEYGCQRPEDINHQDEFNLGLLVKDKYKSDIFIIDEYPKEIRPFYTYVNDNGTTRSYDFVMRGCEILSGAQRVNNHETLIEAAKQYMDNNIDGISSYLDSFKYGSPIHGGGAFGLERLIGRILNIENIRETSLFPRDPTRLNP